MLHCGLFDQNVSSLKEDFLVSSDWTILKVTHRTLVQSGSNQLDHIQYIPPDCGVPGLSLCSTWGGSSGGAAGLCGLASWWSGRCSWDPPAAARIVHEERRRRPAGCAPSTRGRDRARGRSSLTGSKMKNKHTNKAFVFILVDPPLSISTTRVARSEKKSACRQSCCSHGGE